MSTQAYRTFYQDRDKKHRNHPSIEVAKGWHVYSISSGRKVNLVAYATEEAAETARQNFEAKMEAKLATVAPAAPEPVANGSYRTVSDEWFGSGRIYRDQRGATQYDNGAGTYGVQIWDNA